MKHINFMRGIGLGMGVGMAVGMASRRRNPIRKSKMGKTLRAITEVMEEITDAIGLT